MFLQKELLSLPKHLRWKKGTALLMVQGVAAIEANKAVALIRRILNPGGVLDTLLK